MRNCIDTAIQALEPTDTHMVLTTKYFTVGCSNSVTCCSKETDQTSKPCASAGQCRQHSVQPGRAVGMEKGDLESDVVFHGSGDVDTTWRTLDVVH